MATPSAVWRSVRTAQCGTIPVYLCCQSAGCCCAIQRASLSPRPCCAPIQTAMPPPSSAGSSGAGRALEATLRETRDHLGIDSSTPMVRSGDRPYHTVPAGVVLHRHVADIARLNKHTRLAVSTAAWYHRSHIPLSPMPWPPYAAKFGPHRVFDVAQQDRQAKTVEAVVRRNYLRALSGRMSQDKWPKFELSLFRRDPADQTIELELIDPGDLEIA